MPDPAPYEISQLAIVFDFRLITEQTARDYVFVFFVVLKRADRKAQVTSSSALAAVRRFILTPNIPAQA